MKISKEEKKKIEEAKDAIFGMIEWVKTPQGGAYWASVFDELDKLVKEPKVEKKKPVKGYFDGVDTWEKAIELLKKANHRVWYGKFVEIKGKVYFDLQMSNHSSWGFSEGRPLLSKEYVEGDDDDCDCEYCSCEGNDDYN